MSNATQDSRNSGDSRRRRSRGGQNRNNNRDRDGRDNRGGGERRSGDSRNDNRGGHQNRRQGGNRAEEFRPQAPRPARVYSAPKMNWWQKILNAIGLYKAPTAPARTERKEEPAKPNTEARAPKSNTRNARSNEGGAPRERSEKEPRAERQPRPERQPRERARGGDRSSVESPRVYVGNLSYDVTEQDLQELFKGIGGVRNVEVVYNRSTHRSKGYGFVEMLHMDEAIRAVEVLNDQHFMGRKLTVSGAKSKGNDEREDKEDRPEREPRKIVVASANPNPAPAAVAEAAPAVAEVAAVETAEPVIQTIVETVPQAAAEAAPAVAETATDLEAKYGFEEPKAKTEEA